MSSLNQETLRAQEEISSDGSSAAAARPRYSPEELAGLLGQHTPTPEQSAIISAPAEPLLVVAGAGSGKTATMADRVVWLVANAVVSPEQILGVTFTRKAAGELASRIRTQLARLAARGLLPAGADGLSAGMLEPKISTYHSYASGIVTDYGLRLGIERDSVLLGAAQSWQLASQVVEAYEGAFEHFTAAKSSLVKAVVQLAGECSEHLREPGDVRRCLLEDADRLVALPYAAGKNKPPTAAAAELVNRLRTRASVAELVERYAAAKRERGVLDFGDLVALAARIAEDIPLAAELERDRFKVVLLDEFQDTSHAQMVLFSKLFGAGHAVTAVGDPNQSIYGFRGASAGQLFAFPTAFPVRRGDEAYEPAPTRFLTVAWRNSVNILSMANTISAPLNRPVPNRPGRRLQVPPLRARPGAGAGRVLLGRYETDQKEAAAIAARVEQYRATAFARNEDTGEAEPTSAAVLCRRRAQMESVRTALEDRNIPYEIVGLGGLLSTPEIVDLVATLRVLADPTRADSLMRLLTGARWRIGPADLMAFADWSKYLARQREKAATRRGHLEVDADEPVDAVAEHDLVDSASLIEALDWLPREGWKSMHGRGLSADARARLDALRRELAGLRTFVGDDLTTLLGEVERAMLLDIEVAAMPGVSIHYARRHLDAFADAAAGFLQSAHRVDLSAFLSWLDAAAVEEGGLDVAQVEVRVDAVQLLTVHASKGLEWDVVFVPGLNAGAFPTARDSRWSSGNSALPWPLRGDSADLPVWDCDQPDQKGWLDSEKDFKAEVQHHTEQEERRLAYVAYTRAKHVLMCTSAVWNGSRSSAAEPSAFLAELLPMTEGETPAAVLDDWLPQESVGTVNPLTAEVLTAGWPYDPLEGPQAPDGPLRRRPGRRRQMERAAAGVLAAAEPEVNRDEPAAGVLAGPAARWNRESELLLAKHNAEDQHLAVELPAHISASMLVDLAADPGQVIRQLRRPVPRRPGIAARKGTAFHAWIEDYFGSAGTLDLDEAGPLDSFIDDAYDLSGMVAAFENSSWAQRSPEAIEVPVETRVDTVVVRGRIDAVFRDGDGSWDLIDWKTGTPPSAKSLPTRAVQLALYRLAWARLKGVPLEKVKAAFFYVGHNKLIRPHDLAGEAALEAVIRAAY